MDQDFVDTMAVPRRQHYEPTDFAPAWYQRGVAACSGACEQGRKKCPTFDACRVPVDDDDPDGSMVFLAWTLVAFVALVAIMGFLGIAHLLT